MAYATVSYGEETPQTIDRFGTEQTYRVWAVNGNLCQNHRIEPVRTNGVVQRMGLRIKGWGRSVYHGLHNYDLDIHGRQLHIRHYSDGRIRLHLDGEQIYFEKKKITTRNGCGWRRSRL